VTHKLACFGHSAALGLLAGLAYTPPPILQTQASNNMLYLSISTITICRSRSTSRTPLHWPPVLTMSQSTHR